MPRSEVRQVGRRQPPAEFERAGRLEHGMLDVRSPQGLETRLRRNQNLVMIT